MDYESNLILNMMPDVLYAKMNYESNLILDMMPDVLYPQPPYISRHELLASRKDFKLCEYFQKTPIVRLKQRFDHRWKLDQKCNCCGETPLHLAVRINCVEILNILAINGARFGRINNRGETALHVACEINNDDMAARLLDLRANPYRTNFNGENCMLICLRTGNIAVAETILRKTNADLSIHDPEDYLLMATRAGSKPFVKLFLDFKAKVNCLDKYGNSAIFLAFELGHEEVFDCLLEHGADTMLAYTDEQNTLLHLACKQDRQATVEKLLLVGAPVNALNIKLQTPLHVAVQYSSLHIIDMLLTFKSNIEAKDALRLTPLHYAIICDKVLAAKYLLSHGASTKSVVMPVRIAIQKKYYYLVKQIVCSIDILEQKDHLGRTIFDAAVKDGNTDLINFLSDIETEAGISNVRESICKIICD